MASKWYPTDTTKDYPFVPSTEEHDRLEEQSKSFNELMFGKFTRAPVSSPKKILDVGCGTGIQTVLLAKLYPEATVVGVDYSPVPDIHPQPENVVYLIGKLEDLMGKHPLLEEETFDLIYQRWLILSIPDWPAHLARLRSLLGHGGYLECQEANSFDCEDANGNDVFSSWKWNKVVNRSPIEAGYDVQIAGKLPGRFRDGGFDDVRSDKFPVPMRGGWKEHPEAERLGAYMNWAARLYVKMLLQKGAREGEDPEALMEEANATLFNGPVGVHGSYHVTVGKKS